jgi:hypothetical protein
MSAIHQATVFVRLTVRGAVDCSGYGRRLEVG